MCVSCLRDLRHFPRREKSRSSCDVLGRIEVVVVQGGRLHTLESPESGRVPLDPERLHKSQNPQKQQLFPVALRDTVSTSTLTRGSIKRQRERRPLSLSLSSSLSISLSTSLLGQTQCDRTPPVTVDGCQQRGGGICIQPPLLSSFFI